MTAPVQASGLNAPGLREPDPASEPLLTRREAAWWGAGWLLVSTLIVGTGFASRDPDSALYAGIAGRLAAGPAPQWIAPEWWGFWNGEGLFREHPAGVFLLPALLGRLGVPAEQAAFVVGVTMGLVALWLVSLLVSRVASPRDGRAVLVLLQLMPAAFLFRVRANHEYPMLCCLLLALVALDGVRRSWWWAGVLAVAVTAALLVKGVFVVPVFIGMGLWILLNPSRGAGGSWRPVVASVLAVTVMVVVAMAYDAAYLRATGEPFWASYWRRQMGPVTTAAPTLGFGAVAGHAAFYGRVVLVWSAPWGLGALVVAARLRGHLSAVWRALPAAPARGLVWAAMFAALVIAVLSPASRFAERYVFSPTFAIGAVGAVVTYRHWPALAAAHARLDRAVPALPAVVWFALVVGRLFLGRFLPRI